eukprot:7586353-Alexandrium_andersonii.AAC.1
MPPPLRPSPLSASLPPPSASTRHRRLPRVAALPFSSALLRLPALASLPRLPSPLFLAASPA